MINCRLTVIDKILNNIGQATQGKPSYNFNREMRYVEVKFDPNSKYIKTYEQAVEVAKSRAKKWNETFNKPRFLDNIFEPVNNFIQVKISNTFVNGKLKEEDFQRSEASYKAFMESAKQTSEEFFRDFDEDTRKSNQALLEQEGYFYQLSSPNQVDYSLKAADIVLKNLNKIKQWESNKSINEDTLFKKIGELGIPKQQLELLKEAKGSNIEQKLASFIGDFSYTIEVNLAKNKLEKGGWESIGELSGEEVSSSFYSNLTVPGGTNYTENEIATPAIVPSIKGHAQFATENGIGWFRSDDSNPKDLDWDSFQSKYYQENPKATYSVAKEAYNKRSIPTPDIKVRRVLEMQSDLFQKGRDKESLTDSEKEPGLFFKTKSGKIVKANTQQEFDKYFQQGELDGTEEPIQKDITIKNQFLQLLNKDNNWVTFFVKSIIQDSAKKGYEKVLFPKGDTASKIEGHTTLEEFKKQKEDRINDINKGIKTLNKQINSVDKAKEGDIITTPDFTEFQYKGYDEMYGDTWVTVRDDGYTRNFNNEEVKSRLKISIDKSNNEIDQLKQELARVEREGFGALKPIYKFYEETVGNVLKKQGYTPNVITDEYGNQWYEVTVDQFRDTQNILFQNAANQNRFSAETTKKNTTENLEDRLVSILQTIGVRVEFLDSLKNKFANDPVAVYDAFNKLISISKGKADVTTLPEEAFHAIVDALDNHPYIERLMTLVNKVDYREILGEEYIKLYKNDDTKLKKEVIGKWLAAVATDTYVGPERAKNLLERFWDFILSKFGKVSDNTSNAFNMELENLLNQVVDETLKGKLPLNVTPNMPKDTVFFQTKSKKDTKKTDKKQNIQSKLLEQEIYFKRRKAKLEDWLKKHPEDHPNRKARIMELDSIVSALAKYEELGSGAGFVETGEIILNNIDNFLRRLETDSLKTYLSRDMDDDLLYTLNTLDVFSNLPTLESRANSLKTKLFDYATEYTMLQVNKFRNVGEELTWGDVLTQNVDINYYRRYFGALADVEDYLGSTIGVLIKRAQNRASTENQKLARETSEWAKKLSDWGKSNGKSYDDVMKMFVQIVDDKAILAKPYSTKFYEDLAAHANKKDGWFTNNAVKTKEGWVPVDKVRYANPQYAVIMKSPVLKEFYNYYQNKLESFGTKLPRHVNKNMIPNLLKNTLSDIIQSDKSTLSKASELVSKVLNIGNYYEDGLILHDKYKNDVIPLKYFKNITPDKKNLDLVQALYKFGEFTNEYDELSNVLPKTRLIQRVMSSKQYIKSNNPKAAISGDETKIFQLADDYIKMQVLGEMKADEGKKINLGKIKDNDGNVIGDKTVSTSDIIDKFLGYNSLLRIGFNPFNALSNVLVGETGNLVEAVGGRYYDVKGLNKATQIFSTQNFSQDSKMNKILELFNPLQELTEYSHATSVSKSRLTREKFMDIMYSPQRAGEKFLQSRTMVAMMFKEKMPDGKSLWEAFDDKGNLKPEYKKNMTPEQYQEFVDRFSDKVQRVNQMIHGRYSQRDAAAAQQWVLMRAILQFKKWIPAAYEARLGKKQYDPRLRDEVEGRYLTGARILKDALSGDLSRLKAGNMTPLELYNMRKNLMEVTLLLATYGLYMMMGWGDDEEKKKSASYKFWIDQADRVSGDLLYWFNPAQMNRTIKSPISLTSTVNDALSAMKELPFVFGEDAVYERGERKGEIKLISKSLNLIPVVKPTADFMRMFNGQKYVEYNPQ